MASLRELCYEEIKDGFWYGLFGDVKLVVDKNTGRFNATKLCGDAGKEFERWMENEQSKELIEYYDKKEPGSSRSILKVKRTGDPVYDKIVSGTYAREELLPSIALWISIDFYHKINRRIVDHYAREFDDKYKSNPDALRKDLDAANATAASLRTENEKNRVHDEAPRTKNSDKRRIFVLIRKNKSGSDHPLYAMRTQRSSYKPHLNRLRKRYPDLKVVREIKYDPNSVNLFHRVKERCDHIHVHFNGIKLLDRYTEDQLVADIERLSQL